MTAPSAYVVHRTRERLRLRIREKRNDAEYFEQVHRELARTCDDVDVRINPTTGSVLLIHPEIDSAQLHARLSELESFHVFEGPEPGTPALTPLAAGISRIDHAISESSGGAADLRTLLFIGIMALAMRQLMRGQIMVPALALVWNAFDLAARHAIKPSEVGEGPMDSPQDNMPD